MADELTLDDLSTLAESTDLEYKAAQGRKIPPGLGPLPPELSSKPPELLPKYLDWGSSRMTCRGNYS